MLALNKIVRFVKGRNLYEGPVVGVEIEVEGENLVQGIRGYRCERDGSLRGENVEYVFDKPVPWEEGYKLIKTLRLKLKQRKSNIYDTGYAGVHVHVNVGDMTPVQLWRYAMAYYTIEPLLLEFCGEDRRNNLFCLPLDAADQPIKLLRYAIEQGNYAALHTDEIRYAALNFKALIEYGSFEFRAMRSTVDEDVLHQWVTMLLELRQFALTDYPVGNILNDLSVDNESFLERLLPTSHEYLHGIREKFDKMLEGVRCIQYDVALFNEGQVAKANDKLAKKFEEDVPDKFKAAMMPPPVRNRAAEPVAVNMWFDPVEQNDVRNEHEPRIDL